MLKYSSKHRNKSSKGVKNVSCMDCTGKCGGHRVSIMYAESYSIALVVGLGA